MNKKFKLTTVLLATLGMCSLGLTHTFAEDVEENEKPGVCEVDDISKTNNYLKQEVELSIDQKDQLKTFMNKYTTDSEFKNKKNIGAISISDSLFSNMFTDRASGSVGTNLGLELCNPNHFGKDLFGFWKFNHKLSDVTMYNIAPEIPYRTRQGILYHGNVTQTDGFHVERIKGDVALPAFSNIDIGWNTNRNTLYLDFNTGTEHGPAAFQFYLYDFPIFVLNIELAGSLEDPGLVGDKSKLSYVNGISEVNDGIHSIYLTSDYDQTKDYKVGDTVNLTYWYQLDNQVPQPVNTSMIKITKSATNKPEDNESEKPKPKDSVIVYRLYNPNNGDHLFTTSDKEYKELEAVGWEGEGIAWFTPEESDIPVYRLYNPNTGEHFYTDSEKEYNKVGKAGWKQEGRAFYSLTMTDEDSQAIYRTFNPNTDGPGSHMFTVSAKEYNNMVRAGWRGEGIAFYGVE